MLDLLITLFIAYDYDLFIILYKIFIEKFKIYSKNLTFLFTSDYLLDENIFFKNKNLLTPPGDNCSKIINPKNNKITKKNNAFLVEIFCEASGRFLVLATFLSKFLSSKSLIIHPALRIKKAPIVNKIAVKINLLKAMSDLVL
jgi:hypothetical protein